jgi:hypothetical protein
MTWRSPIRSPLSVGGGEVGLKSSSAASGTAFDTVRPRDVTSSLVD